MNLLSRMPGFLTILIAGIVAITLGLLMPELNPNWVLGYGIVLVVIAILAVSIMK